MVQILTAVSGYKTYTGLFLIGLAGVCSMVGQEDIARPIRDTGDSLLAIGAGHKLVKQMSAK